ncbi:winged helix-turn-helix transcriptional regulator [Actomonas aquatica]|uniref:Helix-turn-helix domain-containing protein n=1 Tax=Actomonas aquatica TaxID=2866162 RepID=A0ABZ1C6K7_9BACT|nr:helix-turn-helix domain-containing protein [Opitutus sp. WL0086]WRQ85950.1 helix-turn-helix domain-containing protein [Opitutus sp. WL0086]
MKKSPLLPVAPGSADAAKCPVRDVLDCIGDRWSLLTLLTLEPHTLRFSELKRAIGDISQRMLAQTLRNLERDGYVTRTIYAAVPPRVDYTLTPLGRSLIEHLWPLFDWAQNEHPTIRRHRRSYDRANA